MSDLIDRERLKEALQYRTMSVWIGTSRELRAYNSGIAAAKFEIDAAPAVSVPVVHGRWESVCGCIVRCNSCGSEAARKSNYCPNCGAKMDGE